MMQIQKIKLISIFTLCLALWTAFLIVDFIENRNFICGDYQGDCCHDGKIETLDKLFCKLHFKQIEYLLVLFPQNSSRCWEAMADYISREYSGKENTKSATSKDKKKTLYYLDQAIKYNPENTDVLSWRSSLSNCQDKIEYNQKIITLFNKNSSVVSEQLVANIYYDIVLCLRELGNPDSGVFEKDFETFCQNDIVLCLRELGNPDSGVFEKDFETFCQTREAEDSINVCKSLLNDLKMAKEVLRK